MIRLVSVQTWKDNTMFQSKENKSNPKDTEKASKFSLPLLFSSLLFIATIAAAYWGIYLQCVDIYDSKTKISEKKTELEMVKAQKEFLYGLVKQNNEMEEDLALSIQAVPVNDEIADLMNRLLKMVDLSGDLDLSNLSFSGFSAIDDPESKIKKAVISLSVDGSFRDVMSLVEKLETSRRVVIIDSITYSRASAIEENLTDNYTVVINLSGFYMPEFDVSTLGINELTSIPDVSSIIIKLRSYKDYSDGTLNGVQDLGITDNPNPFTITKTESDDLKVKDKDNDGTGISAN